MDGLRLEIGIVFFSFDNGSFCCCQSSEWSHYIVVGLKEKNENSSDSFLIYISMLLKPTNYVRFLKQGNSK